MEALIAALEKLAAEEEPADARGRTRARIIRVASELFQQRGYRRTSVDDVAKAAGIAKGSVYLHFKTKAEILFHAIAEEKRKFVGEFLPLFTEDLEPRERLHRYLELALTVLPSAPLLTRLMTGDNELLVFLDDLGPELQHDMSDLQIAQLAWMLEGVVDPAHATPEALVERAAVLRALLFTAPQLMDVRMRGTITIERFAKLIASAVVDGIGAP